MEFIDIKNGCDQKMDIVGNVECAHMRMIISGLDGCLCREDNCFKIKAHNKSLNTDSPTAAG